MSADTYQPLQNGIPQTVSKHIDYHEVRPNQGYADVVHRLWVLKSAQMLQQPFAYTVLPDACVDIVFDVQANLEPIVMTPSMQTETIDLGTTFYYAGIRFKPGVFAVQTDVPGIVGKQQTLSRIAAVQVQPLPHDASRLPENDLMATLENVVQSLVAARIVAPNPYIEQVVQSLQQGLAVSAIADRLAISERQLRRTVQQQTGFSPVQLRRVIRFQEVLASGEPLLRFADQSHLIKEFKAVTGKPYGSYIAAHVDVRKVQS